MTIEFIPCSTPGKFMSALKLLMTEFMTVLAGKGQLHGARESTASSPSRRSPAPSATTSESRPRPASTPRSKS